VANFSNSCPGKAAEREDIADNREEYTIESAGFALRPIATFAPDRLTGVVEGPCIFIDRANSGPDAGKRMSHSGTCRLETKYEDFRWYLCSSTFLPPFDDVEVPLSQQSRYPGRLVTQ
jgi:hypothetical protein